MDLRPKIISVTAQAAARVTLQSLIDAAVAAAPNYNGLDQGACRAPGVVNLPAGEFTLDQPLLTFGGVHLVGQGGATVIRFDGIGPAIEARVKQDHKTLYEVSFSRFTVDSDGLAIASGMEALTVQGFHVEDVTVRRGAIASLGAECYRMTLKNVRYHSPMNGAVFAKTPRLFHAEDVTVIGDGAQSATALFDLQGPSSDGSFDRVWCEGDFACPFYDIGSPSATSPGYWEFDVDWKEPRGVPQVIGRVRNTKIDADSLAYFSDKTRPIEVYGQCDLSCVRDRSSWVKLYDASGHLTREGRLADVLA